jgi:hypothetical protein
MYFLVDNLPVSADGFNPFSHFHPNIVQAKQTASSRTALYLVQVISRLFGHLSNTMKSNTLFQSTLSY